MRYAAIERRPTRCVNVGGVTIGSDAPVCVQSMTNTPTRDALATIEQVRRLAAAGAELVRIAAATSDDTAALDQIVKDSPVPIIADVHFQFTRALEAMSAGVAKVRLNPGNISDRDQVRRVISAARRAGVAIRVGVNEGSVLDRAGERRDTDLSRPLEDIMFERLSEYLEVFHECDFHDLVLSAKAHDPVTTVAVNRRIARTWNYPIHLGLTHAGPRETAAIRSSATLGALLCEGIGDTIRISYCGDPIEEVSAARELLFSLRLRPREGIDLIACPTCGRVEMDIAGIVEQIRTALSDVRQPITVAVMGCVVNGPGEAGSADVAICAGRGHAVLYRGGKKVRTVTSDQILQAIVEEVRSMTAERE